MTRLRATSPASDPPMRSADVAADRLRDSRRTPSTAARRGFVNDGKLSAPKSSERLSSPPERFDSDGGSRTSMSALEERERLLDVHTERLHRVECHAGHRRRLARPRLPLVEALLD